MVRGSQNRPCPIKGSPTGHLTIRAIVDNKSLSGHRTADRAGRAQNNRDSGGPMTLEELRLAVGRDAALRRVQKLQPVGGPGDKIFPPTYPGERNNDPPRHVFEMRRFDSKNTLCVLIDSVQSQANRLEEALKVSRNNGLMFPVIAVDFAGTEVADMGRITTLDAPHRVFDAIMRDSQLGGVRLKDTDEGKRLVEAKP